MKKIVLTLLTLAALSASAFGEGSCPGCAGRKGHGRAAGAEKKIKLPGKLGDVHADKAFNKASKARDRAAKRAARG